MSFDKNVENLISQKQNEESLTKETPNKIIIDDNVFSSNFLPDDVYFRDIETKMLINRFYPTTNGKYCPDLSIYGVSGAGKTMITKSVFKALSKEAENTYYIFIPCTVYNTPVSILKFILNQIYSNGKGRSESDFYKQIKEIITNKLLVLIFDEIDIFLKKDKSYENLIQVFSDWNECVLVFISNDPGWHEFIKNHRTISRLHLSNLIFKPYNTDEIYEIIEYRSDLGLKLGSISIDSLSDIAEFTSQYNGDARVAIKILSKAASYAEMEGCEIIEKNSIERAIDSIEEDNKTNFVNSLPPQHKLILIAIYVASEGSNSPDLTTVYQQYKNSIIDTKIWKKLSKNTIRVYIDELETYRLIKKYSGKGRGRGKGINTTKIFLNFDRDWFKENIIMKMLEQNQVTIKRVN